MRRITPAATMKTPRRSWIVTYAIAKVRALPANASGSAADMRRLSSISTSGRARTAARSRSIQVVAHAVSFHAHHTLARLRRTAERITARGAPAGAGPGMIAPPRRAHPGWP